MRLFIGNRRRFMELSCFIGDPMLGDLPEAERLFKFTALKAGSKICSNASSLNTVIRGGRMILPL